MTEPDALTFLDRRQPGECSAAAALFVMASSHAPPGFLRMVRHGQDVLVVWDHEREDLDACLEAALLLAIALVPNVRACVVLAGRCHERENVPFKAFDSLVDELSRLLRRTGRDETATLLPREVFALARLFPVLDRLQLVAATTPEAIARVLAKHGLGAPPPEIRAKPRPPEPLARPSGRREHRGGRACGLGFQGSDPPDRISSRSLV